MMTTMALKVVIPSFSITSLGTARCLANSHFDIFSIGSREVAYKMPMYFSNIPRKKVTIPAEQNIVQALLDLQSEFEDPPVLLLTRDKDALEVSKSRNLLDGHYKFLLPDNDLVDKLMHKGKFAKLAQQEDFRIPRTIEIKRPEEICNAIREFSFPFVLKPYLRHACKINDEAELESYLNTLSPVNWSSVVAQEWIPGNDASIYFCFVYFDQNSEIIASLTAQKIRQWPPEYGTTSLCRTVENRYVLEETVRIFRRLGLVGFGSIEYKYHHERDAYYIMEPTVGRFNQQIAITHAAGVNFPLLITEFLTKGQIPQCMQKNNVWWIYEPSDYLSQRSSRQQNKGGYWRHLLRSDAHVLWSWRDPLPFLSSLVTSAIHFGEEQDL